MRSFDELLAGVTARARQIADGTGDPSELGVQIWALTMGTFDDDRGVIRLDDDAECVASPLHAIFGELTDPVDWPGKEAEIPAAEDVNPGRSTR